MASDEPNSRLRAAREARPSPTAPGEPMSRAELADAVNEYLWRTTGKRSALDAHTIARYERGKVRWPSPAYRAGLKAVLGVRDDAELGFRPTPRGTSSTRQEGSPTGRAQEGPGIGSFPQGLSGITETSDLGRNPAGFLADTVVETPVPLWVGWTDVEYVRRATRAVAMSENLFGGGLCCEAASSQLRWVGALLDARASNDVRSALFEAVGNLSSVVAYSAFDIANHTAADRYFQFSLWCAEQAGSWALRANTLAEMARKAVYLGDLDEALTLVELAQVREDRLSATARAMLWTLRARTLALTDRTSEALTAVDRADACFADRDTRQDPPWLCYYDDAEHQGSTGKALIPLAVDSRSPEVAAPRLREAIRLHNDQYPRSRAFSRTRLASLLMTAGDPHEAVPTARKALTDAEAVRSTRIARELRGLEHSAASHSQIPEVAELRHDLAAAATANA